MEHKCFCINCQKSELFPGNFIYHQKSLWMLKCNSTELSANTKGLLYMSDTALHKHYSPALQSRQQICLPLATTVCSVKERNKNQHILITIHRKHLKFRQRKLCTNNQRQQNLPAQAFYQEQHEAKIQYYERIIGLENTLKSYHITNSCEYISKSVSLTPHFCSTKK